MHKTATSGGSDVKDSYNDLKKAYPQYNWGESRLMNIIKKSRSSSLVFFVLLQLRMK